MQGPEFNTPTVAETQVSIDTQLDYLQAQIGDRILDRLRRLPRTLEDNRRVLILADFVWRWLANQEIGSEESHMTAAERHDFALASILSDVGKSGPVCDNAEPSCQQAQSLVNLLYEETRKYQDPDLPELRLAEFLKQHFPVMADKYISDLDLGLIPGLDSHSTLRAFFDIHTQYTLDLLITERESQIFDTYPRAALAAAAHHWIQGSSNIPKFNGQPIINLQTGEYQVPGFKMPFDKVGVWVMVFDKYEANFTRKKRDQLTLDERHSQAIAWLKEFIGNNQVLIDLPWLKDLFNRVIEALNQARPYQALNLTADSGTSFIE